MALFDKLNMDKISELARAVTDKTVEVAKNVGDKAGDMLEIGKQSARISATKSSIEELKTRLGEHYWQQFENGQQLDDDAVVLCNTIREYTEELAVLQAQLEEMKAAAVGALTCTSCGAHNAADALFCKQCGASLAEAKAQLDAEEAAETESTETVLEITHDEAPASVCPNCGAENLSDSNFCEKCGSKLN